MIYTYSRLSSDSIIAIIKSYFHISGPISCKYYVFGLHDNYLVQCNQQKFIFRVYRNDWRTEQEIEFEIDLLSYLDKKSVNVAAPVKTKNSRLSNSIECPEGKRIVVLFNYANGHALDNKISLEECMSLGSSVANIHKETKYFKTRYTRKTLNLSYLVEDSIVLIKPFLNSRQYSYLQKIQSKINMNISQLNTDNADYGICIGDINSTNFHIDENKIITHFDFDQCGYGYRAFEIGKFSSSLSLDETKKDNLHAFIQGYEKVRKLTHEEKMAIPYFEIASIIWVMSIHVKNVNKIGYQYLENPFWDKRIGIIEALNDKLI